MTSTEIEVRADPGTLSRIEQVQAVERELFVAVAKDSLFAIPICVAIWVGLVSLALAIAGSGNFAVMLPVAAGIGVVAGAFFGGCAAFLSKAEALEALDRQHQRPAA